MGRINASSCISDITLSIPSLQQIRRTTRFPRSARHASVWLEGGLTVCGGVSISLRVATIGGVYRPELLAGGNNWVGSNESNEEKGDLRNHATMRYPASLNPRRRFRTQYGNSQGKRLSKVSLHDRLQDAVQWIYRQRRQKAYCNHYLVRTQRIIVELTRQYLAHLLRPSASFSSDILSCLP
jgi:hypothetical protein